MALTNILTLCVKETDPGNGVCTDGAFDQDLNTLRD